MPMHFIHLGWSNTWFTVPYFFQISPAWSVLCQLFIRCQMKGEKAGQHLELTLSTLAVHTWQPMTTGVVNEKSGCHGGASSSMVWYLLDLVGSISYPVTLAVPCLSFCPRQERPRDPKDVPWTARYGNNPSNHLWGYQNAPINSYLRSMTFGSVFSAEIQYPLPSRRQSWQWRLAILKRSIIIQ